MFVTGCFRFIIQLQTLSDNELRAKSNDLINIYCNDLNKN